MYKHSFLFVIASALVLLYACGGNSTTTTTNNATTTTDANTTTTTTTATKDPNTYDPKRGEGKFSAENLQVGEKLDATMATAGEKAQGVKCSSCHKLTDEKLVGPGWKGVTQRRTPYWIMNFITNPDPMIDKDPEVQAQLELCLVRMPNQNLTDYEARQILEFMRKN